MRPEVVQGARGKEHGAESGLNNKKWSKAIKVLTKNNLAKVEKSNEDLFVSLT